MASAQVNRATNVKQRDQDIDRKLQLYGIVSAFQNGKLPSNDQIDATLNSFIASKALSHPSDKLSAEGRALVADFRDVVTKAKYLLLSKNQGNLLQDFIWQTSNVDYSNINVPGAPLSKDDARQHGDNALEGLKTLGNLLITNGQFRKLLQDASTLFRDILADSAVKASSKVRPSEEALAQIDEPAPDNTWHDTPNFSKENFKQQAQGLYKKNKPADAPEDPSAASQRDVEQTAGQVQDATKAKSDEYRERTRAYLRSKMPEERRDQAIWRLKKMVLECQQHPDYQRAVETLLDLAEQYHGHAKTATSHASGVVKDTRSRLDKAEQDLKTLIERFANGTSTDGLWASIDGIYSASDKDPELKQWFQNVDRYLRRCLLEKGYILEDVSTQDYNRLYDHGHYLLREKHRPEFDRVTNEIKFLADQFDKDPQNKAFGNAMNKLFMDLGNDQNGKPTFKPHLVKDLTYVILPAALESLSYIPIPRIEYSDPQVDAVIENLVLESDNFTPNMLEIFNNNHVSWGRKLAKVGKNKHAIQVNVSGIQMDLRNVNYYIKRKQGFPSITDMGIFSLFLAGNGFGFQLGLSTADRSDSQHFFKVEKVHVDIDHLKVTVHKSQHKLLFSLFKPILLRALRPTLQSVLQKAIRDSFNDWDATLYQIKQEADRADREAGVDPDSPQPNSYNRFFEAAKKHASETKQRKAAQAKKQLDNKKLNFALTREDSIFPNINMPGSFSSKAAEYKEMARKGEDWQSPVFTLGSAGTSKDIPDAPQVEKKSAPPVTNGTNSTNGYKKEGAYGATGVSGTNGTNITNGTNGAYTNGTYTNGKHNTYGTNGISSDVGGGSGYNPTVTHPASATSGVTATSGGANAVSGEASMAPTAVAGGQQGTTF